MSAQPVETKQETFGQWAIVELMGHVRIAGFVTEENRFGAVLGRIEIPNADGSTRNTQYFGGGSVYRLSPVTREIAISVAAAAGSAPVTAYEMRTLAPAPLVDEVHDADEDFDDGIF